MKTSYSAILLVLLVAAATKDTLAITRPATSTTLTVQSPQRSSQGLSVDEEGNLYSTYSPSQVLRSQPFVPTATTTATTTTHRRTIPASSSSSSASKTRRRKTPSSTTACVLRRSRGGYTNKNFIGDLCVDNEGNLYSSSSSSSIKVAALSKLRGGSLCVDNEGNFYSPPAPSAHAPLQGKSLALAATTAPSSKLIASSCTDHLYQKILLVRHHSHNQKNREDEKDKNKKEKTTQRRAFVSNSRRQTHQAPAHRRGDSKQQQGRSSQSESNKRDRRRNSRFEDEDAPHALMET